MSVSQIWEVESEEDVDLVHLLGGDRGVLISSGFQTHLLDEAGLKRWTLTLKGDVVGLGFAPRENTFFIAYENGIRLVNRIGVTVKEVPLGSRPVDFAVSEIAAVLTEKELLGFSREGRELWKADFGGSRVTSFRKSIFVADGRRLVSFSRAGRQAAEAQLQEDIIALAPGREHLFVLLANELLSLDEGLQVVSEKALEDRATDIAADRYVSVLLPHRVVLYDATGGDKWLLSGEASDVSTKGNGVAVASGKRIGYYEEIGDKDVLFEIMCRGEKRCGTFVSSTYVRKCPKCRSPKITMRVVRKEID